MQKTENEQIMHIILHFQAWIVERECFRNDVLMASAIALSMLEANAQPLTKYV